jgi:hypothetical protein
MRVTPRREGSSVSICTSPDYALSLATLPAVRLPRHVFGPGVDAPPFGRQRPATGRLTNLR